MRHGRSINDLCSPASATSRSKQPELRLSVLSAITATLFTVNRRRGDVAFYGLLACSWIVAGLLAVWNPESHSPAHPRLASRGASEPAWASVDPKVQRGGAPKGGVPAEHHTTVKLTIRATRGPSWIQIRFRSARGRVRYEGTLEQGGTLNVQAPALWARIGAVANVDVRIDRHRVQLGRAAFDGILLMPGSVRPATSQPLGIVGS